MTFAPLACVVLAAGKGTRMRSAVPKLLHPLCGRPLIEWPLEAVRELRAAEVRVVVAADDEGVRQALPRWARPAVQERPLGTADALASARESLGGFAGDVLVLNGDHPLVDAGALRALLDAHRAAGAAASVLTFERTETIGGDFGRVVRGDDGGVRRIVEATDASPEELALREVSSGYYVFAAPELWDVLARIQPHNEQGELYLPDALGLLAGAGRPVAAHRHGDPLAAKGVNTRADLAEAAAVLRARLTREHMLAGVTIVDPASTHIDAGVEIEADATIHPFTVLSGRTRVAAGAVVGPHAVLVDAQVGADALVGPFAYLRPGTVLEAGAKAGTFVEMKNAHVGPGSKVPHLSYVGDAEIGADSNLGAGSITANYDGVSKQRTVIGSNVHTSCDNVFVAPVTIGDGAWTAAGSVITDDVPPDALGVARTRQTNIEGYGRRKRR